MSQMRIGGLASGMDIDGIVEKLMQAEKAPLNKLQQQQQKYEWERDAYREINTALKSFDDFLFNDYRLMSNFYKKSVSSSNDSLVSATATAAATGSLAIEGVSQLATSWQGVGEQINANLNTKMGFSDSTLSIRAIEKDGKLAAKATDIQIKETDTISDVIKRINSSNAGVTAVFENGRLSVTANNTGVHEGKSVEFSDSANVLGTLGFNINTDNTDGSKVTEAKNAVFQVNGIATERASNTFSLNGYSVTLKQTFNATSTINDFKTSAETNLNNAISNLKTGYEIDDTTHETILSDLAIKIGEYENDLANATNNLNASKDKLLLTSNLNTIYNDLSDEAKTILKGLNKEQIENLVASGWDEGSPTFKPELFENTTFDTENGELKDKLVGLTEEDINQIKSPKTAGDIYSSLSNATKDFLTGLSSDQQLEFANLDLENLDETLPGGSEFISEEWDKLRNLSEKDRKTLNSLTDDDLTLLNNVKVNETNVKAETAKLSALNNASTQYLNSYETNQQAEAMVIPENEPTVAPVTLNSSTNVDDMVDKIKKFVETYNGLVTTLNDKLKETKHRDFPPLTDDQKVDMSEDEIKKWEEKARSGLLRGDSILSNGLYSMRRMFSETINGLADSTMDSLAEIGITTTSSYSDGGKLQIDEDKLREKIEKNADQVAQIFTKTGTKDGVDGDTRGLAQKLRDELNVFTKNIEKKAGKTTDTNHNFTIGKRIVDIEDRIATWKRKLEDFEARYWKQFTAMEQAINKANQQASLFMPQM